MKPCIKTVSLLSLVSLTSVFAEELHTPPCGAIPDPFPLSRSEPSQPGPLRTAAALPSRWDARDYGWVTPVKNQGNYGTCWAFAACSVLETALLKAGRGTYDLSEKNMVLNSGWNGTANSGGNITMSGNYLTSWQGPVLETEDPYPISGSTISRFGTSRMLLPKFKVVGAVRIPARSSTTDNATMKNALMKYGSLVVPYYSTSSSSWFNSKTGAYYCNQYTDTNHLVALVGWNDNYSKYNFNTTPAGNGAWIVKNSWGTTSGDNGYIYVSYYDTTFGSSAEMTAFIIEDGTHHYDAVYNYGRAGYCSNWGWGNTSDTVATAAIFTAASDEMLSAVGFYALSDKTEYKIQVYRGCSTTPSTGTLVYSGSKGVTTYKGYVTIPLNTEVALFRGQKFSVVVKLRCPTYGYPIAYAHSANWSWMTISAEATSGCTFYRNVTQNGQWYDFTKSVNNSTASACCAAYVRERGATTTSDALPSNGATWKGENLLTWYKSVAGTTACYLQFGKTPGAFASVLGRNGFSMVQNYMLGFSPEDTNAKLQLDIHMQNGEPVFGWNRTNQTAAVYTILGSDNLKNWHVRQPDDRFFKLQVSLP